MGKVVERVGAVAVGGTRSREPRLRADASRNRERIVAAAREALVEQGADIPLDEVARRAGVGNATLYRNFADRRELVRTVTLSVLYRTAERAEAVLAEEADVFDALCRFVHDAAEERVGALCTLLTGAFDDGDPELDAARDHLAAAVDALVDRARSSGRLRPDVGVGDLMVALSQLSRPLPGTGRCELDQFLHRHLQLFLDGLRAPARSVLTGSPATLEDLQKKS
ncbi:MULTISPECIES: TetR/AcrR family transcriptional regulator [Streptomycetaceae]|uniref:TetR family transcriptional regulator n=1 Tax=Streptantibioticus cattleyicolor (strain ATCC 35852 / DSM 46488 / JCM 4925 / NBRC 14057 / NRRL 8057) TaxID=1003195 RepID=F8JX95_STREN|nr:MULTISPECIES: TetR/AcrR family transcriptional regulator [Streptomycetaceae]AEW94559.1 TetR family transcriptional regulator [Streptantibioticus cattleyicolor NRRL 8057 = DSM 46488]MYS59200.1 TetR family transcriptional regulator [Streptomyces sp. SID5468]CCB74919.1 TetR-family transcriptional regulator [Streptantibioticus cattleyicolor NRRL 8057 = DSM 46488]